MDTWQTEQDFLNDMAELNEISEEVNEEYWTSCNNGPSVAKPPSVIPIETPTISNAAAQRKITYNIISDMSKANISFEPDYKELLMKQKLPATPKGTPKEPQQPLQPKRLNQNPDNPDRGGSSGGAGNVL